MGDKGEIKITTGFDGTKRYWRGYKLHREDGPAVSHSKLRFVKFDEYWLDGHRYEKEYYDIYLILKRYCVDSDAAISLIEKNRSW